MWGCVYGRAAPEGVGEKKYDETAARMIAMLRYGSGFPGTAAKVLQENVGTRCQRGPNARS